MMNYLSDFMISGEWLIAALIALIPVIGAVWIKAKGQGLKEATNNITLQSPVPEVPTRKVLSPPSWDAHHALVDRVTALEMATQELRRETSLQYHELLKAGGARETHLSDKLDGIARSIHARIDELLTTRPRPRA